MFYQKVDVKPQAVQRNKPSEPVKHAPWPERTHDFRVSPHTVKSFLRCLKLKCVIKPAAGAAPLMTRCRRVPTDLSSVPSHRFWLFGVAALEADLMSL